MVEFHVMDIKPTFNLLLGRPWIHELGAIPSSLHQMIRLNYQGLPMTIHASPLQIAINDQSLLEINHDNDEEDMWGFAVEPIFTIEME